MEVIGAACSLTPGSALLLGAEGLSCLEGTQGSGRLPTSLPPFTEEKLRLREVNSITQGQCVSFPSVCPVS